MRTCARCEHEIGPGEITSQLTDPGYEDVVLCSACGEGLKKALVMVREVAIRRWLERSLTKKGAAEKAKAEASPLDMGRPRCHTGEHWLDECPDDQGKE